MKKNIVILIILIILLLSSGCIFQDKHQLLQELRPNFYWGMSKEEVISMEPEGTDYKENNMTEVEIYNIIYEDISFLDYNTTLTYTFKKDALDSLEFYINLDAEPESKYLKNNYIEAFFNIRSYFIKQYGKIHDEVMLPDEKYNIAFEDGHFDYLTAWRVGTESIVLILNGPHDDKPYAPYRFAVYFGKIPLPPAVRK